MHTIKQTLPPSNSPNNFLNTSLLSLNISSQYNDNEYRIENLSNKTVAVIKKADIKTVKVMKKAVFIKTAMNEMIFFPKTAEVLELFDGK